MLLIESQVRKILNVCIVDQKCVLSPVEFQFVIVRSHICLFAGIYIRDMV